MSCNLFSQTDTIKKVVLNEETAKAVVKDLLKGDICQERFLLKEEEIKNLTEQNEALVEIIKVVASATALFMLSVLGFATVVAFVLLLS